jgi:hypothetical protein
LVCCNPSHIEELLRKTFLRSKGIHLGIDLVSIYESVGGIVMT